MTPARWILLALLAALAATATAVLTSERVFRFAATQVVERVHGLEVGDIHGRLISGVRIGSLAWRDEDGGAFEARGLEADWRVLPALTGRLRIGEFTLDSLELVLPAADETVREAAPDPFRWPDAVSLPLDLRIGALSVARISVSRGGEPLASFAGITGERIVFTGHEFRVGALRARGDPLVFELEATLEARGDWPLTLDARWSLAHDDLPALDGETRLVGTLREFDIHQLLHTADASAELRGVVAGLRDDPSFRGTLQVRYADLPRMNARMNAEFGRDLFTLRDTRVTFDDSPVELDTHARVELDGPAPRGRLNLRWQRLQWPLTGEAIDDSGSGTLRLEFDDGRYTVDLGAQYGDDADGRVRVQGRVDWPGSGTDPTGSARIEWSDLVRGAFTSERGSATVRGAPSDWHGELSAALETAGQPGVELEAEASGDRGRARIARWHADTPGGPVRGDAELDWSGPLRAALSANARGFDPGGLYETWPGALDLDLEGEVRTGDLGELAWHIRGLEATGTLRGQALIARLEAHGEDAQVTSVDARVEAGENSLRARGALTPGAELEWSLDAPAPAGLLPGFPGAASAHGTIRRDAERVTGLLNEAAFSPFDDMRWTLQAPARFSADLDRAELEYTCWVEDHSAAHACVESAWSRDERATAEARLDGMQVATFARWLPAGLDFSGEFEGEASLVLDHGGTPSASFDLRATPGIVRQEILDETLTLLAWESVSVAGDYSGGTVAATLGILLADGGRVEGSARIPLTDTSEGPATERPMHARLSGEFRDFDLLPVFVPEISSVTGQVNLDLTVNGTRRRPAVRGTLEIEDGVAGIPRLGIRLTDMRLDLDSDRDGMRVRASARSGPGELEFVAGFRIEDGKLAGEGTLTGRRFEAVNLPEARILLDPDITLALEGRQLRVEGGVAVPLARLEPRDYSAAVTPAADQVIVDQADEVEREDAWRVQARVRLTLGDQVRFSGYGLQGRIGGGLVITETPGQPTRASGELQVLDGRYRAWGQELTIERGRLLYADGPIDQPGLDIRAVRRPQDVVVGVNVRGTLEEPEFSLFSTPAMPQSEIMSWLVLGRPLAQAGGSEQELVDRATTGLGMAGGELLLGEMSRRLGIDEVGIEQGDSPEQAALVIGHYLSPRLYVAYGIGLFDPGNTLRLRYRINDKWSVEGETGPRASSSDLIYTIER